MKVRVLAFARVREILEDGVRSLELKDEACVADAWGVLAAEKPELALLASSTRIAQNGRLVEMGEVLHEGDELALLPPSGGG